MRNIQERIVNVPARVIGEILDSASGPNDRLWPAPAWPPLILDAGLSVGSRGGHGPVRYAVTEYEPGRHVRFQFDRSLGLPGYHEFTVTELGPNQTLLTHTIDAQTRGTMRFVWPFFVRWMHGALLQDLLDTVEIAATGQLSGAPARWSPWVRLLRRGFRPAPTKNDPVAVR